MVVGLLPVCHWADVDIPYAMVGTLAFNGAEGLGWAWSDESFGGDTVLMAYAGLHEESFVVPYVATERSLGVGHITIGDLRESHSD